MTRKVNSALIVALSLPVLALPAAASGGSGSQTTHSFEGSCAIVGYAELEDPMTLIPTQSYFRYRGRGRCMGTLDGTVLPDAGVPVRLRSEGARPVHSCAVGIDPGMTWRLRFKPKRRQRGVSIHGFGDIIDVLRSQTALFHGQSDGTAVAQNTIQGHAETLQRCFAEGVSAGSVGIQMDTVTPLVSDGPARR
jgi:hypothetical protein